MAGVDRHPWIGAYRDPAEGGSIPFSDQWRWSDGSPWVYTSWLTDQPDNLSGDQYFVYTNSFGLWADINDQSDTYICEIETTTTDTTKTTTTTTAKTTEECPAGFTMFEVSIK